MRYVINYYVLNIIFLGDYVQEFIYNGQKLDDDNNYKATVKHMLKGKYRM